MLKSQLFLAALTLSATTAFAQGLPETNGDPANDTIAGAEAGACGSQHYGSISVNGDEDVWAFSVATQSDVTVWTSARGSAGITDTTIDIFDSNGAVITTDDDSGEGLNSLATTNLNPGNYFVNVRGWNGTTTGDYAFDILCQPSSGLATGTPEVEPNDTCSQGTLANCNERHDNVLQVAGDVDFYCMSVISSTNVTFETINTGAGLTDSKIWLYDSTCTEVANDDDGGVGTMSLLTYTLTPGTWYLEVSHWQRNGTGGYGLEITCPAGTPIAGGEVLTDLTGQNAIPSVDLCGGAYNAGATEVEPNDTCATATAANCCDEFFNSLQAAGDVDFYCLSVASSLTVTFETHLDTASANQLTDSKIWLYDSNCVEIDNDDDGGAGLLSKLTTTLSAGTYYLEVSHWQRNGDGDYRLTVDCATVAVPDPGCPGNSGFPLTWSHRLGELARFGSQWTIDATNLPGPTVVFFATNPIAPIELGIIGMP
ncbi:MAG: PPC domain-containing protein, partial [Planctomycetes bacterium]|nr:PPC domain-containing protein [Planctomycetota bacterium]